MLVSLILGHIMKIYHKRQNDPRNVMVSSIMYLEQFHERGPNQDKMIHIHLNPNIMIQTRNLWE